MEEVYIWGNFPGVKIVKNDGQILLEGDVLWISFISVYLGPDSSQ